VSAAAESLPETWTEGTPFTFIVACGRSGTTLLRAILDSHSDMAVPPETRFIMSLLRRRRRYEPAGGFRTDRFVADLEWNFGFRELELSRDEARRALDPAPADTPDAIRRVFARYAARRGKSRYGNKTPVHVLSIPELARAFPEARFIHIIRDGRDVALSYLQADIGPDSIEAAALRWRRWVGAGRAGGRQLDPGRYVEVRYEQLVDAPEETTRAVCAFLELPFDPATLRYFERADEVLGTIRRADRFGGLRLPPTKGLRDWRRDMGTRDREVFQVIAGNLLESLGYELVPRPSAGVRARARVGAAGADLRRAAEVVGRAVFIPIRRRFRRPRTLAAERR